MLSFDLSKVGDRGSDGIISVFVMSKTELIGILYLIQEQLATLRRHRRKTSFTSLSTTRKG